MRTKPITIGGLQIPNNVFLAPLAGYTNYAFRKLCLKYGAGLAFPEMMNARGFLYAPAGTRALLRSGDAEPIKTVQLFGKDPALLRKVCESEELKNVALVDLNMGCPMPKICKNGEGSALLAQPDLAARIVSECKKSGKLVSVKFRIGLDRAHLVTEAFAKRMEDAGADLLTIHGRTREQIYAGEVDYAEIAKAKRAVSVPVIANGGALDPESAERLLGETGADGIMIARGALYNPQIFAALTGRQGESVKAMILEQLEDTAQLFSPHFTVVFMRKMVVFYLRGRRDSVRYKERLFAAQSREELENLVEEIFPDA